MRRIRTDFFVSAYRMQCEAAGAFVVFANKGDATAGAVYIRIQIRGGPVEIYEPVPNLDDPDERAWTLAETAEPLSDAAEAFTARVLRRDPDAWVVDVEAPDDTCRPEPIVTL